MLASLATLLIAVHAIGAAIGAGGATYAEIFYTKAIADGKIDTREREYFATTYWALRYGMLAVLISGIALMLIQYVLPHSPDALLYAPVWMQNTLALTIVVTGGLMTREQVHWWLGSAIVFSGWWLMLILDAARSVSVSFFTLLVAYVLLILVSAAVWGYARLLLHERYERNEQKHSAS